MADRANSRTDRASRTISARPETIYRAFVDPDALVEWLPPQGMRAEIFTFEPRPGGTYRMALTYDEPTPSTRGKTSGNRDVVEGRFVELLENQRIVQAVTFQSNDPVFAGEMHMTWSLTPVPDGTEVTITAENVPSGISRQDHAAGLKSTLENLAAFVE